MVDTDDAKLGTHTEEQNDVSKMDWRHRAIAWGARLEDKNKEDWTSIGYEDAKILRSVLRAKVPVIKPMPEEVGREVSEVTEYLAAPAEVSNPLKLMAAMMDSLIAWYERTGTLERK